MTTELERAAQIDADIKAADERRKSDAEEAANHGEKLDNILKCLDSLGRRMDAYEAAKGKEGEDGDGEEEEEKGDPKPLGADSRKDSQVRSDSDAEEIEHFTRETGATYAVKSDSVLAHIQSAADKASSAWGRSAKTPWDGESITAYRRRTAREHQQYSENWKNVDLNMLSGQTLRNAVNQIFADSISASSCGESMGESLREVRRRDPDTGHLIKEYYGSPMAWMSQFTPARRIARFNVDAISRRDRS
jgi:hypothetical protein